MSVVNSNGFRRAVWPTGSIRAEIYGSIASLTRITRLLACSGEICPPSSGSLHLRAGRGQESEGVAPCSTPFCPDIEAALGEEVRAAQQQAASQPPSLIGQNDRRG